MQGWGHGSGPRGITLSILKSKPPECVPHVLLESSQELSKYIWDEKDDRLKGARTENLKLSVFQPNLEEGALAYLIDDDDHLQMTIHLASMYGKFYDDEEDHGSTAMFEKSLEAMQAYHETGSEPVIMVHAGSHTTLAPDSEAQGNEAKDLGAMNSVDSLTLKRSERESAAMMYAMLSKYTGLDIRWLASAFPQLLPKHSKKPFAVQLATRARETLYESDDHLHTRNKKAHLPWPTMPCIFYSATDSLEHLHMFKFHKYRQGVFESKVPSSTDKLLEEFEASGAYARAKRKFLVKVAATDLKQANPLDNPSLRHRHLTKLAEMNFDAVLLDARVGVIDPTLEPDWEELNLTPPDILGV